MERNAPAGGGRGRRRLEEVGVGERAGGAPGRCWRRDVSFWWGWRCGKKRRGERTFFVSELKTGEVVAEDLRVGVVAIAVATASARFTASPDAVWLVGWTGVVAGGGASRVVLETFVVFAVDSFLEVRDPAVDFGLGFQEALFDVFADHR